MYSKALINFSRSTDTQSTVFRSLTPIRCDVMETDEQVPSVNWVELFYIKVQN